MPTKVKPNIGKRVAVGSAGGGVGGVAIAWAWNTFIPDYPMPAEVAAAIAPIVSGILSYALAYLPPPPVD